MWRRWQLGVRVDCLSLRYAAVPAGKTHTARSDRRLSKVGFSAKVKQAVESERLLHQKAEKISFWQRVKNLWNFPWFGLACWMLLWTWGGAYLVPKLKGLKAGEYPEGFDQLPEAQKSRVPLTPHWVPVKREVK